MGESNFAVTATEYPASEGFGLRGLWEALRRHRYLIFGVAATVVALVAAYTLLARPVYEGEASLRIVTEEAGEGVLGKLSPLASLAIPDLGGEEIKTEIGVLRSRRIAEAVVDSFRLQVQLRNPRAPRDSVLEIVRMSESPAAGVYTLFLQPDGSYRLEFDANKDADPPSSPVQLPAWVEIGSPVELGGVVLVLRPALREEPPRRIRFVVRPPLVTIEDFQDDLRVERQDEGSKLIDIDYRTPDRWHAAAVPNAVAMNYIAYNTRTSKTESRNTVALLRQQISEYTPQLQAAEERLRNFRERQQVISPEEQAKQQVGRVAEVQGKLDQLQVDRRSLSSLLQEVDQAARTTGSQTAYRQLATYPSFLGNPAVQGIVQQLSALEEQRSQFLLRRTPENDEVQRTERRPRELQLQLYRFATNYLESLDIQIAAAQAAIAGFGGDLEQIPGKEMQFTRLVRDQRLLDTVYTLLQARLKEAEIKEAVKLGDARIVDSAFVPHKPYSPKPLLNLVLATFLGLILGVTAAVGKELLDTTVRSQGDADEATAGLPVLGLVPLPLNTHRNRSAVIRRIQSRTVPRHRHGPVLEQHLATRGSPWSVGAEAYRTLRTNLTHANGGPEPQILMVTSALPGEGKSTVAANLAAVLAQRNDEILLIDADLRAGQLHELFGVQKSPGLADLLSGEESLEDAVHEVGAEGTPLYLLPSGASMKNPVELLESEKMQELLSVLRARYKMVILDAPPINLIADAAVLGTLADATLLVARMSSTDKSDLQNAADHLRYLGAPLKGVVLCGTDNNGKRLRYGPMA